MVKIFLFISLFLATTGLNGERARCGTCPAYSFAQTTNTLSFEQAVMEAMAKKPSIHAFHYAIKNYKEQRKGALSSYLPNVTLSEKAYNSNNASQIESAFGVQASQTVINFSTADNIKMFNSYISSTKHEREQHKDEIRLATETSFLNSWLLQQKVNAILLLFNATKAEYAQAKNEYRTNLLDKNDFLKAKVDHTKKLVVVNNYKDDIASAERALEFYVQRPIALLLPKKDTDHENYLPTKLAWKYNENIKLHPFALYYKKALANRKDLKAKQDAINLKAYTSNFYAKQYLPTVSLFGNATKSVVRRSNSVLSKEAGIQVSWNIFDGLSNYFSKSAADAERTKAILEKSDLIAQIKLDVQKAHSALQTEIDTLIEKKISFNQISNEYELRQGQLTAGLLSPSDFTSTQYQYEEARINWLTQIVKTTIKERELLYACGYPNI